MIQHVGLHGISLRYCFIAALSARADQLAGGHGSTIYLNAFSNSSFQQRRYLTAVDQPAAMNNDIIKCRLLGNP